MRKSKFEGGQQQLSRTGIKKKRCAKCGLVKRAGQFHFRRYNSGVLKLRSKCIPCSRVINANFVDRLREEVFTAYGGRCTCECGCVQDRLGNLTIDHINGDGASDIPTGRKTRLSGYSLFCYLKRAKFPKDRFRALCWNCNCSRYYRGRCGNLLDER